MTHIFVRSVWPPFLILEVLLMCRSSISSETLHRHRNGGMRGEKWVGREEEVVEEGSCATEERRGEGWSLGARWGGMLSLRGQGSNIKADHFRLLFSK